MKTFSDYIKEGKFKEMDIERQDKELADKAKVKQEKMRRRALRKVHRMADQSPPVKEETQFYIDEETGNLVVIGSVDIVVDKLNEAKMINGPFSSKKSMRALVKPSKEKMDKFGYKIADIGPGGKESNVKTHNWKDEDDMKKEDINSLCDKHFNDALAEIAKSIASTLLGESKNPFKKGDKVRVNRQGSETGTVHDTEGNMVYYSHPGQPQGMAHHTKLVKVNEETLDENNLTNTAHDIYRRSSEDAGKLKKGQPVVFMHDGGRTKHGYIHHDDGDSHYSVGTHKDYSKGGMYSIHRSQIRPNHYHDDMNHGEIKEAVTTKNMFGPHEYQTVELHPDHFKKEKETGSRDIDPKHILARHDMVKYGHENGKVLHDVRIHKSTGAKTYHINGHQVTEPNKFHKAIEKHFNLKESLDESDELVPANLFDRLQHHKNKSDYHNTEAHKDGVSSNTHIYHIAQMQKHDREIGRTRAAMKRAGVDKTDLE